MDDTDDDLLPPGWPYTPEPVEPTYVSVESVLPDKLWVGVSNGDGTHDIVALDRWVKRGRVPKGGSVQLLAGLKRAVEWAAAHRVIKADKLVDESAIDRLVKVMADREGRQRQTLEDLVDETGPE